MNKNYQWTILQSLLILKAFLVAQTVKNLPAMQETQVRPLIQDNPLEKGMEIYASMLAWRIPRREEPGGQQSMGSQRVGHDWATNTFIFTLVLSLQHPLCLVHMVYILVGRVTFQVFCSHIRLMAPILLQIPSSLENKIKPWKENYLPEATGWLLETSRHEPKCWTHLTVPSFSSSPVLWATWRGYRWKGTG